MGETSEMMLDGTLCEGCGEYLGADLDCPALCRACANERKADGSTIVKAGRFFIDAGKAAKPPKHAKIRCLTCGRAIKVSGLADHTRVMHGSLPALNMIQK